MRVWSQSSWLVEMGSYAPGPEIFDDLLGSRYHGGYLRVVEPVGGRKEREGRGDEKREGKEEWKEERGL